MEQDQDLYKDQMESVVSCRSGPIVFLLGVFTKYTKLAIMPILASEALLRENKKNPVTKCCPSGDRTTGLGF